MVGGLGYLGNEEEDLPVQLVVLVGGEQGVQVVEEGVVLLWHRIGGWMG